MLRMAKMDMDWNFRKLSQIFKVLMQWLKKVTKKIFVVRPCHLVQCYIFFIRAFLWLFRHTDEPQKGRNSCLWLQSRSVLSSFGVVLMSCRAKFSRSTISIAVFCLQNLICLHYYFCWSGLYRSYVVRHIPLRSFAVLCGLCLYFLDLTIGRWLDDIFNSAQINLISSYNWNNYGDRSSR